MNKLSIKIKYNRADPADASKQAAALAELFCPTLFAANREMSAAMAEARRILDAPTTEDEKSAEIAELEALQKQLEARLTALKGARV